MMGVIQKQNQQIKMLDNANIQLVSKSKENNFLIGGLKETEDEWYHHVVQSSFMTSLVLLIGWWNIWRTKNGDSQENWSTKAHAHKCSTP